MNVTDCLHNHSAIRALVSELVVHKNTNHRSGEIK